MTRKEQILRFVKRQDDDVSFDKVIYHLSVMRGIEIGMAQVKRGEVIDHDDVLDEELMCDAQEKTRLDNSRVGIVEVNKASHREGRAENGRGIRRSPKEPRKAVAPVPRNRRQD